MSCSLEDLKAYAVGELTPREKANVEDHARACQSCREELDRLNLTRSALASLEDEEIPRRIAFVSDKVFAPKWWQQLWNPTFAAACVVAAAILVHAFASRPSDVALQQAQIDAAVAKAVAAVETRQSAELRAAYEMSIDLKVVEARRRHLGLPV